MSRGLDAEQLAAAASGHRVVVPLIEMLFDSGTLRITSAPWNIVVGEDTYVSTVVVQFRQLRESVNSIEGMEFHADGLNAAFLTIAHQEQYRGRIVRLLKAYLNAETHALIGTPRVMFIGRIKSMPSTETNAACSINVIAEHYDAELGRAAPSRLNDADQQRFYPGDLGCQYAESMVEKVIVWPSREALKR